MIRVAKRNRARHDYRGNRPKLFEHPTRLVQLSRLRIAGGEIARDSRVLRHLLPRREICRYRIVEPTLKKIGAADQDNIRRVPKTRTQANSCLDVLDRNIRLARVKPQPRTGTPAAFKTWVEGESTVDEGDRGFDRSLKDSDQKASVADCGWIFR